MKRFLLISIYFFLINPAFSLTIQGGVSYSVNEARIIAFNNIEHKIDTSVFESYFVDKDYDKNKANISKNKFHTRKYNLTVFSDNSYSISYKARSNICFYYDLNGKLESIGYTLGNEYPKKGVKYYKNGYLEEICLIASPQEQFIFDKNKKLIAHWKGKNCYNEKGELIMTREAQ